MADRGGAGAAGRFDDWGAYTNGSYEKFMNAANAVELQRGGIVHMQRGGSLNNVRFSQANNEFMKSMAMGGAPIVVPLPVGGGGSGGGGGAGSSAPVSPPSLNSGPSNIALARLTNTYNLSLKM